MPDDPNAPVVPVVPVAPASPGYIQTQQTATPGQIQNLRDMVKELMASKNPPPSNKGWQFYTWANGLDSASAKILAGLYGRQADQLEQQAGRASGGGALGLPGQPAQPTNNTPWWKGLFSSTDGSES